MVITGYVLEWDQGGGAWATHLTPSTTSATSTGLTGGTVYQYRVSAVNKYGTGPASPALSALAAQAPDVPAAPTTTPETIYVKVAWAAPSSNHAAIDAYQILVATSTGDFVEDTATCDGASASVRDALYCLIPMTALWTAPFNLPQGAVVRAKVQAHNDRGWSGLSAANSAGAGVETVPLPMAAPTRGSSTSDTAVQIDWLAVGSGPDGGSPVLGYALYGDGASNQATWTELAGYSALYTGTSFTMTEAVTAGATYHFKVMAKNKWGWGSFSPVASIFAAKTPAAMGAVTTSIDGATGGVTLAWSAPSSNGGSAITAYLIEIKGSDG